MPMSLSPTFATLLQAAADTAAPRILIEHSWLDTLANVAQSLVSVLLTVMLLAGVFLLYALKKSVDELGRLIKSAHEPLGTVLKEAREITAEVRTLTRKLTGPVTLAGETIEDVSDGVRAVMSRAESRLGRLDALVQIAQDEAEGLVVGAASLLRGVRTGGSALRRSLGLGRAKRKAKRSGSRFRGEGDRGERSRPDRLHHVDDERPRIRPRPSRKP